MPCFRPPEYLTLTFWLNVPPGSNQSVQHATNPQRPHFECGSEAPALAMLTLPSNLSVQEDVSTSKAAAEPPHSNKPADSPKASAVIPTARQAATHHDPPTNWVVKSSAKLMWEKTGQNQIGSVVDWTSFRWKPASWERRSPFRQNNSAGAASGKCARQLAQLSDPSRAVYSRAAGPQERSSDALRRHS